MDCLKRNPMPSTNQNNIHAAHVFFRFRHWRKMQSDRRQCDPYCDKGSILRADLRVGLKGWDEAEDKDRKEADLFIATDSSHCEPSDAPSRQQGAQCNWQPDGPLRIPE